MIQLTVYSQILYLLFVLVQLMQFDYNQLLETNKIQSKMSKHSIPQMNKQLQQLNTFFTKKSTQFCVRISHHPGKITNKDEQQFAGLIQRIKNYAITQINKFFQQKIEEKCQIYDHQITNYSESGDQTETNLNAFREQLEEDTVQLKLTQNRKENLLDHFSAKYNRNATLKRYWAILKKNKDESLRQKQLYNKMKKLYVKNLMKKSFFPWRRLTYKQGYENTVKRQTEKDTMNIHEQYQSIISILKTKIVQTEEVIKVKKAAKGEFAYSLSKNLLKTISNLSMEVMSLNQISIRDEEASQQETKKFMTKVDKIIDEKLNKVKDYKNTLMTNDEAKNDDKKKKKIKFVE